MFMDSLKFYDVGLEKRKAFSRHSRIRRITAVFRFLELCVFLVIFSRYSTQISFNFKISCEYFRGATVTLVSPQFVFFIGNAIVVALLLGSGKFSAKGGQITTDFYDEYVQKSQSIHRIRINYPEKEKKLTKSRTEELPPPPVSDTADEKEKKLTESRTEKLPQTPESETAEVRRDLKRSRSGNFRKAVDSGKKSPAEEMSSEEFRRTVEAFIERQQRFLREEEE